MSRPPERISADGFELRRFTVADAPALDTAILASIEHLRPWMPWIAFEPLSLPEREDLITGRFAEGWDNETDFGYGMFDDDQVIGGCGLHRRIDAGGIEIGY